MLSNASFLAKIRFDTAENEPATNLQNLLIFPTLQREGGAHRVPAAHGAGAAGPPRARAPRARPRVPARGPLARARALAHELARHELGRHVPSAPHKITETIQFQRQHSNIKSSNQN